MPGEVAKKDWRADARKAWSRLRGGDLTPRRAFWSVGLGLFVGTQPTPGLHLPALVLLGVPLRLDVPVAYLAANISIPPIAPFLWFAALQIGARVWSGQFLPLTVEGARAVLHAPGVMVGQLALGSVLLGLALGACGGGMAFVVAGRLQRKRRRDPLGDAIQKTAERFARAASRRSTFYYVQSKLKHDPAVRAVVGLAPLGDVIDLGCGRGQLAILLLESRAADRVRGFDWDDKKIALAERAAEGLSASFRADDVRRVDSRETADTVLLVDVLHYMDAAAQDALVLASAELVKVGGRLVVRDADAGHGLRSWFTRFVERISIAIRFNLGERMAIRDVRGELVPLLERAGFACTLEPCWGGTPFSNVLLTATKKSATPPEVLSSSECDPALRA